MTSEINSDSLFDYIVNTNGEKIINEIMQRYNIENYTYDIDNKTLTIYQKISVRKFIKIRNETKDRVDNYIIKTNKRKRVNI